MPNSSSGGTVSVDTQSQQSELKRLIIKGKEQGFLTYREINDHLPEDMNDTDQIETVVNMINDLGIEVYDAAPDADTLLLKTANSDDDATKVNTTANVLSTELTDTDIGTITFNADGTLATPATGLFNLTLNFPENGSIAATTETVALDISKFVQFDGDFQTFSYTKNGYASASTRSIKFDGSGNVVAGFDDATFRSVYRIPLAQFFNANGLQEYNGNIYQATEDSGTAIIIDVNSSDYASFSINAHELSNVNLTGEFTKMMMTQTAYNSSSTVFKTVDEMVATARDLKR